jgi:ribonuclease Z
MVPTKERNHLSVALEYNGSIFLFDCGEGTQTQIKKFKVPIGRIKKIFISHWHGDHTLGLNGLIQTLSNTDNIEKLEIHGPKETKTFIEHMLKSTIFDPKIELAIFEHEPKDGELLTIIDTAEYQIKCTKLAHSVPCIGYSFCEKDTLNVDKDKAKKLGLEQSPLLARIKMGLPIEYEGKKIKPEDLTYKKEGKKIAFVFDTRPCKEISLLIKNANVLVMEATYIFKKHGEKAEENDHMSAKETALLAAENNVKTLYITHFSQRYKDIKDIEEEAKESFENTISTYDGMEVVIK